MAENQYDAIVIGAGHNGLTTAGYLAKDGLSVLVLERLDKIGGAATTDEFTQGFSGPMCSYIQYMLQGKVIDDLKLREHGLEVLKGPNKPGSGEASMSGIHPFPDGTFTGGPDIKSPLDAAEQIRQFSENDARNYFEWTSFWEQAASILHKTFLAEPPTVTQLIESVKGTRQEEVLEKMLTWSVMDLIDDHFEHPHVRATSLGIPEADPSAPGSIMSNAYFTTSQFSRDEDKGIPRGSMGAITQALAASVRDLGAEIRTRTPVQEVIIEDGEARGVRLANGEEIRSFIVVSNADPKRTFSTLVDSQFVDEATKSKIKRWKTNANCVKFLAAMSEPLDLTRFLGDNYDRDQIVNVSIGPSVEYFQQSWDDAIAGRVTDCPLMHIQMPSLVDPNLAPRGGVVMSNWILYYPAEPIDQPWETRRDAVGEQIIDAITEYAPNFRESLIDWSVQAPIDIETRVGITDGNIRHGDMIPSQMLANRFAYRTSIRNFYMCGAGTHPGGEVTAAPGHNSAHAILRDLERIAV